MEALAERLARWGPERVGPYHVVVPPRPHVARWLERARQQLPVEDPGAVVTVCAIAKRAGSESGMDVAARRRWLPWAQDALDDPRIRVSVVAAGERPLMLRLPADGRKLPPEVWEQARLDADRVLVAVSVSRCVVNRPPVTFQWIMGQPPPTYLQWTHWKLFEWNWTTCPVPGRMQRRRLCWQACAACLLLALWRFRRLIASVK